MTVQPQSTPQSGSRPRPSWYALERGGWRDYVTLLHLPYTAWHVSYVVIGGCLASTVAWGRLGAAAAAFALACPWLYAFICDRMAQDISMGGFCASAADGQITATQNATALVILSVRFNILDLLGSVVDSGRVRKHSTPYRYHGAKSMCRPLGKR